MMPSDWRSARLPIKAVLFQPPVLGIQRFFPASEIRKRGQKALIDGKGPVTVTGLTEVDSCTG